MSDPVYNEDVRQFILDRYEELGHASREMRTLYDARTHGKFTRRHTTVVRDIIAVHLNEHFTGDTSLPDLSTWEGFNTPQRAYKAEGGHGLALTFTLSSNAVSTVGVTDGGEGYARPPTIILTDPNPFANPTDADLEAMLGVVTGVAVDTGGDGYTSAPTVALTAPDDLSGVQATATATVTGGAVSSVTMTENGSGYASAPTATLSGGGATTDATISASVDTGKVGRWLSTVLGRAILLLRRFRTALRSRLCQHLLRARWKMMTTSLPNGCVTRKNPMPRTSAIYSESSGVVELAGGMSGTRLLYGIHISNKGEKRWLLTMKKFCRIS